ncbi:S9 family peptidase [Phenylobacterium sp.]|uniref:alpha/beta hydrolase family protein n=1 Tax=Phenylobacterium sp. TaxID=1871053 RepID=UPI002BD35CDA|nr:S9 family peptidase [Phenylobacterium sp.]HVI32789.1 S9 family peptidase [Phenylobacterium sp.]
MFRLLSLLAALAALVAWPASAAPPLQVYGSLPTIDEARVAPDGSAFAVVAVKDGQRQLLVRQLKDGATARFGLGEVKVRGLDWVGSKDIVLTTSRTGTLLGVTNARRREHFQGFHLDLRTNKLQRLLGASPGRQQTGTHMKAKGKNADVTGMLNVLAGPPEVRVVSGEPTLFLRGVAFRDTFGVLTVFKANLGNGQSDVVEFGGKETEDILIGASGEPLAQTVYEEDSGRWALKLRDGPRWKEVRSLQALHDRPYLAGLGRDGQSVLIGEMADRGYVLREVGPDGALGEPLPVENVDDLVFDPVSQRLIGAYALVGDEDRYTFFDPNDQRAWRSVQAAFKGARVKLVSWSNDRKVIIVLTDSPTEGPAYALVDLNQKKASFIGPEYLDLMPEHISPVAPVRFKARDGLELTGYLTTPQGSAGKKLPLVVFPHGGPAARDEPGFDWWAQAMASRGYAVLQVNFRGSSGFGWDHLSAGFGQWGRKMQTDLSDGVAHLAAQGVVDPKRVCIVGASYGGYAALAGAALEPDVYRCAASVAGLSDLKRFVDWAGDRGGADTRRWWSRFMGAENGRDPVLAAYSPALHADKVKAPVLLVHGRDDTVVPLEQSRVMAEALQRAGKPVELVVQPGEDHWLSQADTRLAMLNAVVAFLEKHNPPM